MDSICQIVVGLSELQPTRACVRLRSHSPSGLICLPVPGAVMPFWLAHLLVPYCSPKTAWPAFIVSSSNCRLLADACLAPSAGPANPSFCAHPPSEHRLSTTMYRFFDS